MRARSDYGVIINARNPVFPFKRVIIIAGAYGFGTWGAIRWMKQARIPRRVRSSPTGFECLIPITIIDGIPIPGGEVIVRPILPHAETSSSDTANESPTG